MENQIWGCWVGSSNATSVLRRPKCNPNTVVLTDFDVGSIPVQEWNTDRISSRVGHKIYDSYVEGKGWEKRAERDKKIEEWLKSKSQ